MMIQIDNLSIGYGSKGGAITVGQGMTASLCANGLTCLIGSNGAGKSTLLKTIAAFIPKLGGNIYIKGKEISLYTNSELSRTLGVVLTSRPDAVNMTVEDVVSLGRTPYTGFWGTLSDADKDIVARCMELVGISGLAHRTAATLSDGERQKMMIAKALAQQTPIILLDEPTAFLDYPSKVETMLLLARLAHEENKTVFMSTHDLELALQTADTLWLMRPNQSLVTGSPRQLADDGTLASFVERDGITFDREQMKVNLRNG